MGFESGIWEGADPPTGRSYLRVPVGQTRASSELVP